MNESWYVLFHVGNLGGHQDLIKTVTVITGAGEYVRGLTVSDPHGLVQIPSVYATYIHCTNHFTRANGYDTFP